MSVYSREMLLRSRDVDMFRRLRTSELFRLLQEASIAHTEELGMGRDKTLDRGLLWVLLLQRAEIARMPEYDERIVLRTWPGKTMHLLFTRYYSMDTAAGEHLLSASAMWGLVDQNTRKMIFPEKYGIVVDGVVTGEEIALPSAPRRMECTESRQFTVPYSYVDINGHMNNAHYFDLVEDCIPAAAEGKALKGIQIEYSNEARFGESFTVNWGCSENTYYIMGEGERQVFRMGLTYG